MLQSVSVPAAGTSAAMMQGGTARTVCRQAACVEHDSEQRRSDIGFLVSLVLHIAVLITLALLVTETPDPSPGITILASTLPEDEAPDAEMDVLADLPATPPPGAEQLLPPVHEPEVDTAALVDVAADESDGQEIRMADGDLLELPSAAGLALNFDVPVTAMARIRLTADGGLPGLPAAAGLEMAVGGLVGEATASMYGLEATGSRFAFVVDRSSSMAGPPLDRLKEELRYAIAGLPREAEFFIVYFNVDALPMPARNPVRATAVHKERFLKWSAGITAEGGTDPSQAMREALSRHPSTVFLITDGQFDPGPTLAEIARLNAARHAQIHTVAIGFGAAGAEPVLRRIAAESGGEFRFVVDEVAAGQFAPPARARGR